MSNFRGKCEKIKLIISDVDGVLTDGSIYKGPDGFEMKRFSVEDGAGIALARAGGLKIALLSGRYSESTEARAAELNIEDVYNGTLNKLPPYEELKKKYDVSDDEIAYVGDGLIDLIIMEKVGVPISVQNGHELVKQTAVFTTSKNGGSGALREAIEWILKSQGRHDEVIQIMRDYLLNHSNDKK